eukprot:CAMPEP_0172323780 /NCGR_PEP_ID=MMETSP1058-20130122/49551_1 /TAXON_ID=83371 /ORGANISM="Detonula confervacea, Strain CCMP 353" /LENGTH=541 /DNA_ID=CAMNT_0013039871 /DNA_START=69 /DNA_END=1691 /DNA_ORIENTATION=-
MRINHRDTARQCRRQGRGHIGSSILTLLLVAKVSGFALPPSAITSKASQRKSSCSNTPHQSKLQAQSYFARTIHCYNTNSNDSDSSVGIEQKPQLGEQKKSVTVKTRHQSPNAQTLFASTLLGLALIFSSPLVPPANAGFGPSGGATTSSPPNLITPSIQDRSDKKLKQLIGGTLNENRLEEFSNAFSIQVDDLTEVLKNLLDTVDNDGVDVAEGEERKPKIVDTVAVEKREAELEQVKILQKQIADQGAMLAKLEKEPYWFNYLAAFIGSVASTLVMHPLDTIKTRIQVKTASDSEAEEEGDDEGFGSVMSLYEGLAGNILKEGPPSALYLGVYETVKYSLLPLFGPQSVLLVYLASGAAGEMVGSIIRAPAEAIKTNVQSGMASNAKEAVEQVFGTAATRANVVRAWSSSVWRDVPFGAIQLAIFELTKTYILNNPDIDFDSNTLLTEAIIGAFAGGWGALLTNPFDIITTRIITQSIDEEGDSKPLGVFEMGKKLYEEGGPAAFLVGWQARVGYWAPAISIFLTCYCSVRQAGVQREW